ncbi:aspartate ammonia-lyase [Helicobacter ailurogastricus]|uniref:Aspartate ammonia-lyase n=1 Tax=Helicobacter ailurogastricus TaxID=1578720 RepID=A0A0K2XE67_9HELI|nr:aspartate ammonia-lyase [Helicobacter ailurogastricus]CRF41722.1 Aspartate ammonia-lyase [Helicobacter ailurogastricus]CRF43858.1 Aspartate ammonia-lyase [Helicobacter ailurogastricus]CRF52884.1 Aspartate ammonia-lyase [Helicobacter ailurogastricus]BDQ28352.1 aspartate ammonia-lyase [Helicobacter ailurogastricus]GLH58685.1 Aspartate ammonia-lyase AspA [Helicobacter ailurogastricus]
MATRREHDFIGEMEIEDDLYYGIQTMRAVENFNITHDRLRNYPVFIRSFAQVKKAAALANAELGLIDVKIKDAICHACDKIIEGEYLDQFVVDMIQGGAGTSTNMNVNEVIANLALEFLGHKKGEYQYCHPNDHVNRSQSTNDAYPSALKIAIYERLDKLTQTLKVLKDAFAVKAKEFSHILKMGRTQLQDAVPMTLGQEFETFMCMVEKDIQHVLDARNWTRVLNLGGTAIGTGINSHPDYKGIVEKKIQEVTGRPFTIAQNLIEASQSTGAYVQVSGALKRVSIKLSKICNDLRLLSSGPRAGLNEINLPKMQPGSSIMPGKVNPVIPEVVNQVCFSVIGNDLSVAMAAEGGQLQLNVFEPVIAYKLFHSFLMLDRAIHTLVDKCILGITANEKICQDYVFNSIGIVTALNPHIGYEKSASIAKEALETGKSIQAIVLERKLLTQEQLDEIFQPANMLSPHVFKKHKD